MGKQRNIITMGAVKRTIEFDSQSFFEFRGPVFQPLLTILQNKRLGSVLTGGRCSSTSPHILPQGFDWRDINNFAAFILHQKSNDGQLQNLTLTI